MTIYYVEQDDSNWGCSEPGCCGESYEATQITFVKLDDKNNTIDKEFLWYELGGGEPLNWRKARKKELHAWDGGSREGFYEGVGYERERIVKVLRDSGYPESTIKLIGGETND